MGMEGGRVIKPVLTHMMTQGCPYCLAKPGEKHNWELHRTFPTFFWKGPLWNELEKKDKEDSRLNTP